MFICTPPKVTWAVCLTLGVTPPAVHARLASAGSVPCASASPESLSLSFLCVRGEFLSSRDLPQSLSFSEALICSSERQAAGLPAQLSWRLSCQAASRCLCHARPCDREYVLLTFTLPPSDLQGSVHSRCPEVWNQ